MTGQPPTGDARRYEEIDARIAANEARLEDLELRVDVDRELIAELQTDGTLSREHAANLEEALRTSRRIGAAVGIIMAHREVGEADAFELLRKASMDTNRKVCALADEIVHTGDLGALRTA